MRECSLVCIHLLIKIKRTTNYYTSCSNERNIKQYKMFKKLCENFRKPFFYMLFFIYKTRYWNYLKTNDNVL